MQDRAEINIYAQSGVAVREFSTTSGPVDYLLYADGKAIGVVEAKPEGHTLTGVEEQSLKYVRSLPEGVPSYRNPLPFHYESTGKETQFTCLIDPFPRSRPVFAFHRPKELLRLVHSEARLRDGLRNLPRLNEDRLWRVQIEAIQNLERSLAANRPRALIQMATGSGKTYTAISFIYRLIKFAGAKRVLFLVDRKTLGRQTYQEFQQYISPYSNYSFTDEFNVQHMRSNTIDPVSRVCITTIQRLFSMLKGEEEFDEGNEEGSIFETSPFNKQPIPVAYNPSIPIETFEFIITDECHRSIYNQWRQVLEYFDAFLIGLTATPTKQTIGFFGNNLVMEYGHEQAVADGVNVGFDIYRIQTRITNQGATLEKEPEVFIPHRDRRTREVRFEELDDDLTYTANQLDRDVVAKDQIRLIVRTFRDRLFTDIFPGRSVVPKTLVFAKDDSHAEDITRIIREEFPEGSNEFCQKITYKTTGKKPEEILNEFRNNYNPRIAVTVDMIATGTDVRSIECLLFMRNVNSAGYFEQMKGRGVRIIDSDSLQTVTPDARAKNRFVIVDAVGLCEKDKTESKPLDRQPFVSFEKLMGMVATGIVHPDLASTLAARLARLNQELDDEQREEIKEAARGKDIRELTADLLGSINPDAINQKAREKFKIAEYESPSEKQLDQIQEGMIRDALKPLHDPKLRNLLVSLRKSLDQVIDEINRDELLHAGYDAHAADRARTLIQNFRQFIEDNKDELEALKLLYSKPFHSGLRYQHLKELASAVKRPPVAADPELLWQAYEAIEPKKVKGRGGKQIADLISLVRHAIDPEKPLIPVASTVEQRYQSWLADQQAVGASFTPEQRQWLDAIKDHIASSLRIEQDDFQYAPFNQLGGLGKVYDLFGDRLSKILDDLNSRLVA